MKITKISALLFVLAGTSSCGDKFFDVNKNPVAPSDAQVNLLLPASQAAMAFYLGHATNGLSQPSSAIMQQLVNGRIGTFGLDGTTFNNHWQGLYIDMLENNELVLTKALAANAWGYAGIAQIQKAYVFSQMVDVWGDLPYSQALQGTKFEAPKFDDDEAIYTDLFRLIDDGIANMKKTDDALPAGVDDLMYGGSKTKWIRLANTLKLKLYNQIRLTRNVTPEITALLATPADLIGAADDFEFRYGTAAGSPENRNPGFQVDYVFANRENSINPYFYLLMKGTNDPRIPYYFFNQVANSATPPANLDFIDGRFISVRFGSTGQFAGVATQTTRTLQGLYPVGGRYDDGAGGTASGASAKGNVPQRFITFFMRKYIEAELQLMVLNNPAAARTAFNDALIASFAKVNAIATNDGSPVISPTAITTYINAALARYDAGAGNEAKLNIIMTEKYVASFGTGVEMYNDHRRTGYPNVPNAATDNDPLTQATGAFPLRFPYRLNDLTSNPNAPAQINPATDKVFWDR
ncbi:SusD/RagB family nutrient-binding outer membrane lipoprotein [Hymenobacter terrenus]|uniref:SusD/RagB family nutrient-binding outer membrane lipoprotein n=1 Tax=Hymenobacter terrenus TaxID=1629124 RepID=UPI0006192CE8|nr:SusD/RagB family nutrient-binding outer membrane lipoprotein [Hymenobacter terrenus]